MQVDGDGKKFGKSEGGAIWLSSAKLSPYKFYQYLFKTTDADVVRFLRMLTFLPLEQIAELEQSMASGEAKPNTAQRLLAEEVTRFVHGEEGVEVRSVPLLAVADMRVVCVSRFHASICCSRACRQAPAQLRTSVAGNGGPLCRLRSRRRRR